MWCSVGDDRGLVAREAVEWCRSSLRLREKVTQSRRLFGPAFGRFRGLVGWLADLEGRKASD
jgi:hypothetical protein